MTASIAIVIPVYGVTAFLEDAIGSAVAQHYPRCDIIVVDDGSDARQAAEIKRACDANKGVTLLRQPHGGPASARHHGVAHTQAELILFLDADDLLLPGALAYFADVMRAHPDATAAYGRLQNVYENGDMLDEPRPAMDQMPAGKNLLYTLLEKKSLLYNGTVCIRREALMALPPQDYVLRLGEDWVLWCHLALAGNIIPAGERVVLHYRRHARNVSSTLLDDPQQVFASIDAVYNDPLFKNALGEKELKRLYERCTGRMHAYLAVAFAKKLQWQEARYHMAKGARFVKTENDSAIAPAAAQR